jgi:hypothetical protein
LLSDSILTLEWIPNHQTNLTWENPSHSLDTCASITEQGKGISQELESSKSKPLFHSEGLLPVQVAKALEETLCNATHTNSIIPTNSSSFSNLEILNDDLNDTEKRNVIRPREAFDILYQRVKDETMTSRRTFGKVYMDSVALDFSDKANTDALFDSYQNEFETGANPSRSDSLAHSIPYLATPIPSPNANCIKTRYCSAQELSENESSYCDAIAPGEAGLPQSVLGPIFASEGLIPNFSCPSANNTTICSQFDTNKKIYLFATFLENSNLFQRIFSGILGFFANWTNVQYVLKLLAGSLIFKTYQWDPQITYEIGQVQLGLQSSLALSANIENVHLGRPWAKPCQLDAHINILQFTSTKRTCQLNHYYHLSKATTSSINQMQEDQKLQYSGVSLLKKKLSSRLVDFNMTESDVQSILQDVYNYPPTGFAQFNHRAQQIETESITDIKNRRSMLTDFQVELTVATPFLSISATPQMNLTTSSRIQEFDHWESLTPTLIRKLNQALPGIQEFRQMQLKQPAPYQRFATLSNFSTSFYGLDKGVQYEFQHLEHPVLYHMKLLHTLIENSIRVFQGFHRQVALKYEWSREQVQILKENGKLTHRAERMKLQEIRTTYETLVERIEAGAIRRRNALMERSTERYRHYARELKQKLKQSNHQRQLWNLKKSMFIKQGVDWKNLEDFKFKFNEILSQKRLHARVLKQLKKLWKTQIYPLINKSYLKAAGIDIPSLRRQREEVERSTWTDSITKFSIRARKAAHKDLDRIWHRWGIIASSVSRNCTWEETALRSLMLNQTQVVYLAQQSKVSKVETSLGSSISYFTDAVQNTLNSVHVNAETLLRPKSICTHIPTHKPYFRPAVTAPSFSFALISTRMMEQAQLDHLNVEINSLYRGALLSMHQYQNEIAAWEEHYSRVEAQIRSISTSLSAIDLEKRMKELRLDVRNRKRQSKSFWMLRQQDAISKIRAHLVHLSSRQGNIDLESKTHLLNQQINKPTIKLKQKSLILENKIPILFQGYEKDFLAQLSSNEIQDFLKRLETQLLRNVNSIEKSILSQLNQSIDQTVHHEKRPLRDMRRQMKRVSEFNTTQVYLVIQFLNRSMAQEEIRLSQLMRTLENERGDLGSNVGQQLHLLVEDINSQANVWLNGINGMLACNWNQLPNLLDLPISLVQFKPSNAPIKVSRPLSDYDDVLPTRCTHCVLRTMEQTCSNGRLCPNGSCCSAQGSCGSDCGSGT